MRLRAGCRSSAWSAYCRDWPSDSASLATDLLVSYGVKPKPTTIKNPTANAIVERIHQTIGDSLRAQNLDGQNVAQEDIHHILQATAFGLRAAHHSALMASPAQVTFGRDMLINSFFITNWRYIHSIRKQQIIRNNIRENKSRLEHDYKVGDKVYVMDWDVKRKLSLKKGPFKIIKVHDNGTVNIQLDDATTQTINIRRLQPKFE